MENLFSAKRKATLLITKYIALSPEEKKCFATQNEIILRHFSYVSHPLNNNLGNLLLANFITRNSSSKMNRSFFLHYIAFCDGYKNWNHMKSAIEKQPFLPSYCIKFNHKNVNIGISIDNHSNRLDKAKLYSLDAIKSDYMRRTSYDTDDTWNWNVIPNFGEEIISLFDYKNPNEQILTGEEIKFFLDSKYRNNDSDDVIKDPTITSQNRSIKLTTFKLWAYHNRHRYSPEGDFSKAVLLDANWPNLSSFIEYKKYMTKNIKYFIQPLVAEETILKTFYDCWVEYEASKINQ